MKWNKVYKQYYTTNITKYLMLLFGFSFWLLFPFFPIRTTLQDIVYTFLGWLEHRLSRFELLLFQIDLLELFAYKFFYILKLLHLRIEFLEERFKQSLISSKFLFSQLHLLHALIHRSSNQIQLLLLLKFQFINLFFLKLLQDGNFRNDTKWNEIGMKLTWEFKLMSV